MVSASATRASSLSLSLSLKRAPLWRRDDGESGSFFLFVVFVIFFPKDVSSQKRKNDFKKKKREFKTEGRETREGTNRINHHQSSGSIEREKERKQTGTDGGQPRADDAFREEEEEKEEINDEQHFGRREGEDVECGRCL